MCGNWSGCDEIKGNKMVRSIRRFLLDRKNSRDRAADKKVRVKQGRLAFLYAVRWLAVPDSIWLGFDKIELDRNL